MPLRSRVLSLFVALAAVSSATSVARADDTRAPEPVGVEVAFTPGSALYPWKGNSPFGLGLGGRAGVTLYRLYLGASVMAYLGTTGLDAEGFVATKQSQLYGGVLGYAFAQSDAWSARVQLGIGEATVHEYGTLPVTEFQAQTPAGITVHGQYFEPGFDLIVRPWGPLLVGADATVLFLTGAPNFTAGFVLKAQLGLAFLERPRVPSTLRARSGAGRSRSRSSSRWPWQMAARRRSARRRRRWRR